MAEKNVMIEKALNINYLNVQKQEIDASEKAEKLLKEFTKKTGENLKEFKKDQKEVLTQKKSTKDKFQKNLVVINTEHEKHLEDLLKSTKKIEENNLSELQKLEDKKLSDDEAYNKVIEKINKEYEKDVASVLKQYDNNVLGSGKETEKAKSKADSDIENLEEKLKDFKVKYDEKVISLNEKKDAKINKLIEASNKKVEKEQAEMVKEEAKTAKDIEALKPSFEERLQSIEEKIHEEKSHFDTKYLAVKSTLESKVARHEKFMNKNIKDNDQRAAKQHKKEITILQKNAEKELKLLTNEHNDKAKGITQKRRYLIQENLEAIATIAKKLIQYNEQKLFQIESYKSILNNDSEVVKLNNDSNLQEELNKYNENVRDNAIKVAEVLLKKEIALEQEVDKLAKLKINFEKDNNINKVKYDEQLAIKAKEFKDIENTKLLADNLSNLNKSIEVIKLESETKVSNKELVLDIKINEENEIIEYHNLDFLSQVNQAKENLQFKNEFKILFDGRADAMQEYEELEINNRAELKIKFLEAQKVLIQNDNQVITTKINSSFEAEQILYDEERVKASSKDLEELKIYEEEANETIKKITEKRNALDAKAYKKEIKDLDLEINASREELNAYVKTKRENITSNTILFDKGIEEVKARRDKSLEELNAFVNQELGRMNSAIEIVSQHRLSEINDAKNRHLKTFEDTGVLLQNAQLRSNSITEETTAFKLSRIQNENDVIKDFKDIFEKQKFGFKETLDESLTDLETEINNAQSKNKQAFTHEEVILEEKVAGFNNKLQTIENDDSSSLEKQGLAHKENYARIEQKEKNKIQMARDEFAKKENVYKTAVSEIEKSLNLEAKTFDTTKKTVKKNYENSLSKNVNELTTKLQQDIKAI